MSLSKLQGDGEGQVSLACCSPWGRKESDKTERLSNSCGKTARIGAETPWFQCLAPRDGLRCLGKRTAPPPAGPFPGPGPPGWVLAAEGRSAGSGAPCWPKRAVRRPGSQRAGRGPAAGWTGSTGLGITSLGRKEMSHRSPEPWGGRGESPGAATGTQDNGRK